MNTIKQKIMKEFEEALVCKCKNERIPEEFNYFGKVIGEWDLDWNDRLNTSTPRRVKGEWIFSWVLDGMAVQDVFIVPSRAERLTDIQPVPPTGPPSACSTSKDKSGKYSTDAPKNVHVSKHARKVTKSSSLK